MYVDIINNYRIVWSSYVDQIYKYIFVFLLGFSFSVDAIEVQNDISKDNILIGPKFVRTPSPFIRFSNSTGGTLHCAAKGDPSPVRYYCRNILIYI